MPTPSRPELAEADARVFDRLSALYGAPDPTRRRRARPRRAAGVGVELVELTRVGGLDAAVLRASDAAALARWLSRHGYSSRPGLEAWLRRYVDGDWYITAFRYDSGRTVQFGTQAVRLSFETDRPFCPYAVPDDQVGRSDQALRVTVISDARMEGELAGRAWAATTGYANRPRLAAVVQGAVPDGAVPPGAWMTTFEEPSAPRGTGDLFFRRSADQRVVAPSVPASRWVLTRIRHVPSESERLRTPEW